MLVGWSVRTLGRLMLVSGAFGLFLTSCSWVTSFDPAKAIEQTNALCADGVDNDQDGLADCHDWKCLSQPACCNLPAIIVNEDFDPPSCRGLSCAAAGTSGMDECLASRALSASVWNAWGTPDPMVCEGRLSPTKTNNCYPVGVITRDGINLDPGLAVEVEIRGAPEAGGGYLEVGLTFQAEVVGGALPCVEVDRPYLFASLRTEFVTGGYRIAGSFGGRRLGTSANINDGGVHKLRISVDDERQVTYAVDGVELGASNLTVDELANQQAYLVLQGLGRTAVFESARVTSGTQCESPSAWSPEPELRLAPDESGGGGVWDSAHVLNPSVLEGDGSSLHLFYTGCRGDGARCIPRTTGIGWATSPLLGDSFLRPTPRQPLLDFDSITINADGPLEAEVALVDESSIAIFLDPGTGGPTLYSGESSIESIPDGGLDALAAALSRGEPGDWDGREVCCGSLVVRGDERLLYYAGRSLIDDTWHVGLARSAAGGPYIKEPQNPVLTAGSLGEFDDRGTTDPEVLYDDVRGLYRLWYKGESIRDTGGGGSIGYAISLDGVKWFKYPGNPVLTEAHVGLGSLGSPAVVERLGRLQLFFHGKAPGTSFFSIYSVRMTDVRPDDSSVD